MGNVTRSRPSWTAIEYEVTIVARHHFELLKQATLIVGIQRGGLIPSIMLSHLLSIPMESINYSSMKGRGDNRTEHTNKIPRFEAPTILLVDDINDTGWTMKEVADEYERRGVNVLSFVLHHKETSVFTPTVKCWTIPGDGPWIDYPWENQL